MLRVATEIQTHYAEAHTKRIYRKIKTVTFARRPTQVLRVKTVCLVYRSKYKGMLCQGAHKKNTTRIFNGHPCEAAHAGTLRENYLPSEAIKL